MGKNTIIILCVCHIVTNPNIGLPISYLINNIIKGNYSNMNLNREGIFHDLLYVAQTSNFSEGNTETPNVSLKFHDFVKKLSNI